MKNRKILMTLAERSMIIAALMAYNEPASKALAMSLNSRFIDGDRANDGPEVAILSIDRAS